MIDQENTTYHYICECGYGFYAAPSNMDLSGPVVIREITCGACAQNQPNVSDAARFFNLEVKEKE